ncbi:MAG: GGDEF domain-containing protein [Bryobacterales bacterium]
MQSWWALLAWADNWSADWLQFETALLAATVAAYGIYVSRRKTAMQLFESEQRFARQSQRDPLTNLPIRPMFIDRMSECFARASRNAERTFGVCVLNLDGFQKVNEQHGHAKGDLLLQTVAERLRLACRRSDMVARLGGDEFVILLDETPTREHADAGADRLCGLSCAPVDLDGVTVEVSASYGVAFSSTGHESEEAMLSAAHKEMQESKRRYHAVACALESQKEHLQAGGSQALPSLA